MKFQQLVEEILQETTLAGGVTSALGPNVGATAGPTSGDKLAPGDARVVMGLYGGVVTRRGMSKKKRKKKK